MKALKRLFLVLALLAVLALLGATMAFDSIARSAIEAGGTHALGVETSLARIDIGVFSGGTTLNGLQLANPGGFETESFLELGSGELGASLTELAGQEVVIDLLAFSSIRLSIERRQGRTNYGVILDHLEALAGDAPAADQDGDETPPEEGGGNEKRFLLKRVEFEDVQVHFDLLPAGGELTRANVTIPTLSLENVGNAEGGVTLPELASELVRALLQAGMEAGGGVLSPELLADLRGKLEEFGLQELQLEGVQAQLESLGDELEGAAGSLGDEAGKALEDAGRSIEGLFKKD